MKRCRVCKTLFEPTSVQVATYLWICRVCRAKQNKAYQQETGYARLYQRRPSVKVRRASQARQYYRQDPGKPITRAKTRRLIGAGKLKPQSCERCGNRKTQAHHDNYADPVNVRWLCRSCHRAEHAKMEDA